MTIVGEVEDRIAAIQSTSFIEPSEHIRILLCIAKGAVATANPSADLMGALRAVVGAERLVRIAYELKAQTDLGISRLLQFAHAAARETYQLGMRAARSLGVRVSGGQRWQEPAVILEPMATPVTYVRGGHARALGLADGGLLDLPFPVVLIPWYPEAALGSLTVIHHEIGHNIDEELGITTALAPALAGLPFTAQRIDVWMQWCREIVADTFGMMFAGTAFLRVLEDWSMALAGSQELSSTSHPYPIVRVALGREVLQLLGVFHGVAAPVATSSELAGFIEQASTVARTIFQAPLPALKDASLQDLAPPAADEQRLLAGLAPRLALQPAELKTVPLRLMPSLARFAVDANANPTATATLLFEHVQGRQIAAAAPFLIETYERTTRRTQVAPILDEAEGGFKRPPPDLFRDRRRFSFVGATNDSLPALFASHLVNGGSRKERIDIFFLAVASVRRLAHSGRSADEYQRLQETALAALDAATMNKIAASWRVLIHEDPYYFAAYFDADQPGGRIHVSAHGWGQDLKRAPSADHVWPEGTPAPARTYAWYLEALNGLHQRATVLRSS